MQIVPHKKTSDFLPSLLNIKLCQEKMAFISYVGKEGMGHFVFCYYS